MNLDFSKMKQHSPDRFPLCVKTIDSHTAGEATRLIVDGTGPVLGETMAAKREYLMTRLDHVRQLLMREPRGHRDLLGALVTGPVTEGAAFGLIYMDARRYPFLCGHATIGAVTTLIETGAIEVKGEGESPVVVDTPSGPMDTRVFMRNGQVEAVAIRTVPSFVYRMDETLEVEGIGRIRVDTVCVGGFFAMVDAAEIGLSFAPENRPRLIDLGMRVIDAANRQLTVHHPLRPEVRTVDVTEIYELENHADRRGSSVVVYGESHMDRSPCGTGTAAKLTLLHRRGLIATGETFHNHGPLGTRFEAQVVEETRVGDLPAVVVEIRGNAQITGFHEFVLDRRDPFPEGFLL